MNYEQRSIHYFGLLSPTEQQSAIVKMRREGHGIATIATATRFSVEAIRSILAKVGSMEVPA